ncbi:hypothetical protein ACW95P_04800 [Candidatus Mycoplasma pogonae]
MSSKNKKRILDHINNNVLKIALAKNEKEVQGMVEQNMYDLFKVHFLAHEFNFDNNRNSKRADSIGIDDNLNPVIFEYKLDTSDRIIKQTKRYKKLLSDNINNFLQLLSNNKKYKHLLEKFIKKGNKYKIRVICIVRYFPEEYLEDFKEDFDGRNGDFQNWTLIEYEKYLEKDIITFDIIAGEMFCNNWENVENILEKNWKISKFSDSLEKSSAKLINNKSNLSYQNKKNLNTKIDLSSKGTQTNDNLSKNKKNSTPNYYKYYDKMSNEIKELLKIIKKDLNQLDEKFNFDIKQGYSSYRSSFNNEIILAFKLQPQKKRLKGYVKLNHSEDEFGNYNFLFNAINEHPPANTGTFISDEKDWKKVKPFVELAIERNLQKSKK